MNIDQNMLDDMWRALQNKTMRDILKMIGVGGATTYTELRKNPDFGLLSSSGKTAYFVKKLAKANILKKDNKTKKYFLTRIGVESLALIDAFEEICTKFDISDCDADGKVETKIMIVGREEPKQIVKCLICPHTAKSVKGIKIHHRSKHGELLVV